MAALSFRNSRIVYYGPHPCENCGQDICRAGNDFGQSAFTYPSGPIYPNTEWSPHFCNPADVRDQQGRAARLEVLKSFPNATALRNRWAEGYVISGDGSNGLIISANCTTYDTQWAAWSGALERQNNGFPTWSFEEKG